MNRMPIHYVRRQFICAMPGESDCVGPVTDADECEQWEPVPSWEPEEYIEAIATVLDLYHDNPEYRFRAWVETRFH